MLVPTLNARTTATPWPTTRPLQNRGGLSRVGSFDSSVGMAVFPPMTRIAFPTLALGLFAFACGGSQTPPEAPKGPADGLEPEKEMAAATATTPAVAAPTPMVVVVPLESKSDSTVGGTVTFTELDGKVQVDANVTGLTPGEHGFHVHEIGDCSSPDGKSAGGHFDALHTKHHGKPSADTAHKHTGDLGNLVADDSGNAKYSKTVDWFTLGNGETSIANRAVIVHAKPDDYGQGSD